MENSKLHIIITGETGKGRSFILRKKTIRHVLLYSVAAALLLAGGAGLLGISYTKEIRELKIFNGRLTTELQAQTSILKNQLAETTTALEATRRKKSVLVTQYEEQLAGLRQEQEALLKDSISRLDDRSRIIESIMDQIGFEIKIDEDPNHSGGPFIGIDKGYGNKLLGNTDRYLEILETTPLGRPVSTKISSKFGLRTDPLNGRNSFHTGIDFKGKTGDNVKATGNAIVKKSACNEGLGKFIILSHGSGYETLFAHLSKRLVKKGDQIARDQVIGLVGNTGRSTGSHLHYELRYKGEPVDPLKFMQLAAFISPESHNDTSPATCPPDNTRSENQDIIVLEPTEKRPFRMALTQ
ncbi:MAG: peptidoglycan DD-metalloendopeptidase family protein [Desulfobulbaceae bacterium]|nr:peptidoglycan DD-metalloendopeptidase family protein [Desulfobulbaceae bacterium]